MVYYLSYGIIWLITRLPLRTLNFFSDAGYFLAYHVIRYRREIVHKNLRNSFPDWDEKKVNLTARKFYQQFCDSMIDSVALHFVNKKYSLERMVIRNPELPNGIYNKGKSVVCLMAHYGNWELTVSIAERLNHEVLALYKPLTNRRFDELIKSGRERFGAVAVPMEKILRYLVESESGGKKTLTYFLADQRPHWSQIAYWTSFLGQDAPVYQGAEKIARKFNMAVLYLKVIPVKRGFYEAEFILLKEDAKNTTEHEIMDLYIKVLEENIREAPEYWLWTHKRWKYVRKP